AAQQDASFFYGAPRTLEQAAKARSFGMPMSREEVLAYWHVLLGADHLQSGAYDLALADFRIASRKHPQSPKAYNEAAWLLATCPDPSIRNAEEAVAIAEELQRLWPSAEYLDTIAAAYAAAGKWKDAVATQQRAISLSGGDAARAEEFQRRLVMYEKRQVYL